MLNIVGREHPSFALIDTAPPAGHTGLADLCDGGVLGEAQLTLVDEREDVAFAV